MKVQFFDKDKIRMYMEGSPALKQGILYCKHLDPTVPDIVAKESAMRIAEEYCYRKWLNDSTGYINEWRAFQDFEKEVEKNHQFYIDSKKENRKAKDAREEAIKQQKRCEKEERRIKELKNYCKTKNLDFKEENLKALKRFRKRAKLAFLLEILLFLAFCAALIMWIFTDIGNGILWIAILITCFFAFGTVAEKEPDLPYKIKCSDSDLMFNCEHFCRSVGIYDDIFGIRSDESEDGTV